MATSADDPRQDQMPDPLVIGRVRSPLTGLPIDSDSVPGLGRQASYLKEEHASNGDLPDDPTTSGMPVRNKQPFRGR